MRVGALSSARPALRPIATVLGIALLLLLYRRVVFLAGPHAGVGGDFVNHRGFGGRFLAGDFLYDRGLDIPYPPLWAMAHAPLALVPLQLGFVGYTAAGIGALVALFTVLSKQVPRTWPAGVAAAVLLVLARPFVLRDLLDGGPNLMVFTLAWGGVFLWSRGQDAWGGMCAGLAAALKCTPALFLLYFAWKRQWRMVVAMALSTCGFTLLPVLVQGPSSYLQHMRMWCDNVLGAARTAEPGWCVIGPEELRNCSLQATLGRMLVELPLGHPGRLEHPWRCQLAHLSPGVARVVIRATLVILLALAAWCFHGLVRDREAEDVVGECAAVALLMLLLSPITWGQHCVAVMPALALLLYKACAKESRYAGVVLALVSVLYVVGLNRTLTGPLFAGLLASYGVVTLSLLLLITACLNCQPSSSLSHP